MNPKKALTILAGIAILAAAAFAIESNETNTTLNATTTITEGSSHCPVFNINWISPGNTVLETISSITVGSCNFWTDIMKSLGIDMVSLIVFALLIIVLYQSKIGLFSQIGTIAKWAIVIALILFVLSAAGVF